MHLRPSALERDSYDSPAGCAVATPHNINVLEVIIYPILSEYDSCMRKNGITFG